MAASTPRKRTPAQKAEELKISSVGDFKKRISTITALPSGAVVKLKNPGGLRAFMGKGTIPNSLMPLISQALSSGNTDEMTSQLAEQFGAGNTELLQDMNDMLDNVVLTTISEPRVLPVPTEADVEAHNEKFPEAPVEDPEDLRYDDKLYVDEFPAEDKQFIFAWVTGGVKDLEQFRQQQGAGVDSVPAVHGAQDSAELEAGPDAG